MIPSSLLLLVACQPRSAVVGSFEVRFERDGTLSVAHEVLGSQLTDVRWIAGDGDATIEMQFGSFRFDDVLFEGVESAGIGRPRGRATPFRLAEVTGPDDEALGILGVSALAEDTLALDFFGTGTNRSGFSADCDEDEHFLGTGSHAQDVDHVGEAFPVWVSEPGIGKSTDDVPTEDWFLTGTKHASSLPSPFLVRPQRGQGLWLDTSARIDLDLCAADPGRFEAIAWDHDVHLRLFATAEPLDAVRAFTRHAGRLELPPPWVFGPWLDAVRGQERVREVAATARAAGGPVTAIWTEDWKGAEETPFGYHLTGEWSLDRALYPDAELVADELEADGIQWLAYFSPFVFPETEAWDEALDADVVLQDAEGAPYRFTGATLSDASMVDLSVPEGRAWFADRMEDALAVGFDGWMADYAEWLPVDAALRSGEDAMLAHNRWPELWQETNREALEGADAVFFARSGWSRTPGLLPVLWGGDQRTSFGTDDGFPTVLALGLGASVAGVPVFTHDVAGYASVGNGPSDKELWFRWCSLGAFSPIFRTHHGAWDQSNWQFDSDEETTAHWAEMAREHMRLFPYRYGLASQAAEDGTPMVLPVSFVAGDADWDRTDAWMLGDALLVAPVLEAGVTGRDVKLPETSAWFDWWTLERAESGWKDADLDEIPVFARSGSIVPTFAEAPDTLMDVEALPDLDEVDSARIVTVFGSGGAFEEGDGTRYSARGSATEAGTGQLAGSRGSVQIGDLIVDVDGPVWRTYTVVVATGSR